MAKRPVITKSEAEAETRSFVAVFNIVADGHTIPPGGSIDLTREEFDALKSQGAISGDWD